MLPLFSSLRHFFYSSQQNYANRLCGRASDKLLNKYSLGEVAPRLIVWVRAQELCESRGGRLELFVPNSPYFLCRRKAALGEEEYWLSCLNHLCFFLKQKSCLSYSKYLSVFLKQEHCLI